MSESRLLWERVIETCKAVTAAGEALSEARAAYGAAKVAFLDHQRKDLETNELARRRLESMRDFGARHFDEKGRVK